jgi:hypothetical protein
MAWLYAFANVGVDDPYDEAPDARLYAFANVGVAYDPTDVSGGADGFTGDFQVSLYAFANVTIAGSGNLAALYAFSDIVTTTPTPHIWYVKPNYGKEGWQFDVVGYGFGDTQPEYNGLVKLGVVTCPLDVWSAVAAQALPHTIDRDLDIADPVHQRLTVQVPVGGETGTVTVQTDGP